MAQIYISMRLIYNKDTSINWFDDMGCNIAIMKATQNFLYSCAKECGYVSLETIKLRIGIRPELEDLGYAFVLDDFKNACPEHIFDFEVFENFIVVYLHVRRFL